MVEVIGDSVEVAADLDEAGRGGGRQVGSGGSQQGRKGGGRPGCAGGKEEEEATSLRRRRISTGLAATYLDRAGGNVGQPGCSGDEEEGEEVVALGRRRRRSTGPMAVRR